MTCSHCGADIADKALICYRCGHATTEPRIKPPDEGSLFDRPRRSRLPLVVIVLVIVVLAAIALWLLRGRERSAELQPRSFTPSEMLRSVSSGESVRGFEVITSRIFMGSSCEPDWIGRDEAGGAPGPRRARAV
ncbi:MAG TPA: hypothetical protein VG871_09400 [Vicinamibacterales bacterium]|nr:hypothetical protein [Vicinamibacterales bacterium]